MKLTQLSLKRQSEGLKNKDFSSLELTKEYLYSIQEKDGEICAYLSVTADLALEKAKAFDSGKAPKSPLSGIPFSVKDNICTKGIITTCASRILQDFVPCYDAFAFWQINNAGGVLLGKTNLDEFGIGGSTESSAYKITKNPVNPHYVPGGSSGGSAAAVAAQLCSYSLGSDTGGSVRQPAAFCGAVGLCPTYGLVSRFGLTAFASSLDRIGPITKTVYDSALVLGCIAGNDTNDATSINVPFDKDYTSGIDLGVKDMVIGLPIQLLENDIDPEIKQNTLKAAKLYESMGARVMEISMPSLSHALGAYYVICSSEASSNLSRFDGVRYGQRATDASSIEELYTSTRTEYLGKEVKRRIALGAYCLNSGFYPKAQDVRRAIKQDFANAFRQCDLLLSPTTPKGPYKIGSHVNSPKGMYKGDVCTVASSLAGVPAISLPFGKNSQGFPHSIQLMASHMDEKTLLRGAFALEQLSGGEA